MQRLKRGQRRLWVIAAAVVTGFAGTAGRSPAAAVTVDSVGALDPNPSNLTITDAASNSTANGVTLADARLLTSSAFTAGKGGVIDFQQQFQGGTWPNALASNNGVDVADGAANPVSVTHGALANPVIFSWYRNNGAGNNVDSNTNQGGNIISGGYKSRDPIAAGTAITGTVDFTTTPGSPQPDPASGGTTGVGGSYLGFTGTGIPGNLVFNNGLSFFGITALPRGATRDSQLVATLSDASTIATSTDVVGASPVFFGIQLTPAQVAAGLSITGVQFNNPNGQGVNRWDDMAFVVASVPEPTSAGVAIAGLTAVAATARRRRVHG